MASKGRESWGKRQREQTKREKQEAKRAERAERRSSEDDNAESGTPEEELYRQFAELSAANKLVAGSYSVLVSGSTDGPTELFVHPTAVSSSVEIAKSIVFKYNSGLSTGKR